MYERNSSYYAGSNVGPATAAPKPTVSLSSATSTFDKAQAAFDKVINNPKSTSKQIDAALSKYNTAVDKYASAVLSSITNSGNTVQTVSSFPPDTSSSIPLGPSTLPVEPTPVTPTIIEVPPVVEIAKVVKTATPDIILFKDDIVPIEVMTDLLFENIGGQELINIARNDTVNGQEVAYQPIKNLSILQQQYNPNNIVSLQQTSDKYFLNFPIKLDSKIPNIGNGPNGSNVYVDPNTGDLIIELVNMLSNEQVEINLATNGTIYEANL